MSENNVIKMQDMTSFKWVMINILGHDFMHDFYYSVRTKKGNVEVGNKKVSIIKKVNKTCQAIAKYLKNPNFTKKLSISKGGGLFDNPEKETTTIGEEIIVQENDLKDNTYTETISTSMGEEQMNYSSYEKELNHMMLLIKELDDDDDVANKEAEEINKGELSEYLNKYFQELYTVKLNESGEIISYEPKIVKILAQGIISGILSPVISNVLNIGMNYQLMNRDISSYINEDSSNTFFNFNTDEEEDEEEDNNEDGGKFDGDAADIESSQLDVTETPITDGNSLYKNILDDVQNSFMKILGASKHGDIGRQLRINTDNIKSIAEINDTTDEELITLMQSESIEQDEPTDIVTLENTIISGNYDESSYFNLTKKLLLKNYVKQYNARSGASVSETKSIFTLFRQNENEEYVLDMRPIENTINELSEILITKFNIDFRTNSESVSQDDYDIFGKSKNPVEEFKHIILNNRLTPKDTNIRTNAPGENAQEKLKNLYRNAMLDIHPDRNSRPDSTEVAQVINAAWQKFKINFVGGSNQRGGGINNDKLFSAMNTILNKAIIENSLVLMDCVGGNKSLGYFPQIKSRGQAESLKNTLSVPHKIYTHQGLRPIFTNLFNGRKLKEFLSKPEFSLTNAQGAVKDLRWDKIVRDENNNIRENTMEIRKILAKRILLNAQILILYQRCIPSGISTNSLFEGLLLKIDNKKRSDKVLLDRGYLTLNLKDSQNTPEFLQRFGVSNLDEATANITVRRKRYFGILYDDTDIDDIPNWLKTSNTEDDMLQNAFNIVLVKLLPEFIFELGKQPNILGDLEIEQPAQIPIANADGTNAYVINNAVPLIYPQLKKASQKGWILNLNGIETRHSNFAPYL